jgi:hypothetical protein
MALFIILKEIGDFNGRVCVGVRIFIIVVGRSILF